jgi:hypothetical protein
VDARSFDQRDRRRAALAELMAEPGHQLVAAGAPADHHDVVAAGRRRFTWRLCSPHGGLLEHSRIR